MKIKLINTSEYYDPKRSSIYRLVDVIPYGETSSETKWNEIEKLYEKKINFKFMRITEKHLHFYVCDNYLDVISGDYEVPTLYKHSYLKSE